MLNPFSFSPLQRVRTRPDFQRTFREGKRLYSPQYILYYRLNNLGYPRVGVITSKRNVRQAVQRNVVKRVARETFRLQQANLKSMDIVLVAQKAANTATKQELSECLEQLFTKLKR